MQVFKQILIGFFFGILINASYLSNGVDIEWKDPGETVGSRQTRDAPSHLSLIRDKLLNVTRFANGLALAESVALGNISFGRIVTELIVAGQFAPGSDWVNILAAASGPELDKVLLEIGSFEGFLEGNITVDFSDSYVNRMVSTILQGKEISKMKKQIESLQKMVDGLQIKAESFDNFKDAILDEKLEKTLQIVPLLTLLPDAIQSYPILLEKKENISHVSDVIDKIFRVVENNETDKLLAGINALKQGFAKLRNITNDYGAVTSPALALRTLIRTSNSILSLTELDETFIKDISNIMLLLSFSEADIEHLETLQNVTFNLANFQETLENLKWNPAKVSSSSTLDSQSSFAESIEELQYISDALEVLKPGSELILLAKKISNKSHAFNDVSATPTLFSSNFFEQSKLLISFDGLQSFIESVKLASSKDFNANYEDFILLEKNVSSQLESVQIWLSQVEQVKVVENGAKSIKWMLENKKNLVHFEAKQKELSTLVGNVNKMAKIEQAIDGFRKLTQLLVWLNDVPKWKENLLAIRRKLGVKKREDGMIIFHISETVSFLKQTLQFFTSDDITKDMISAAENFTNLNTIGNSLKYIDDHYKVGKSRLEYDKGVVDFVNLALSSTANWDDAPEFNSTKEPNNTEIEKSLKLIDDFKNGLVAVESKKELLDEMHKDIGELEGLVEAANLMSEEELESFKEGIKKVKLYRASELAPPSNTSSADMSSIFQTGSDDVSLLDSLVSNFRAYSDLIFGLDSVKDPIKLSNEILVDQGVPDEMKEYLKKFQNWFSGAKNLEILSEVQVELKSVSLLNETTSIKGKLQSLIGWLSAVPKDAEPSRVRRSTNQSSPMSGNPQEGKYAKLMHLIEKAQDPETTEAIEQLGKDLTRLAGVFGIEEEIVTTVGIPSCQENPSHPMCTPIYLPSNVNSANNLTNNTLGMSLEASSTQAGWLMDHLTLISVSAFTILLLVGTSIFLIRKKKKQAATKKKVGSSSKSHSRPESLDNVEKKVQKSAKSKVKSETKTKVKSLKEDKTAEMDPEDEEGIPLIRRIFPTYDPERKDLVFLSGVNVIEGGEQEAARCAACVKNECSMTMLDGKPLNRALDRSVCKEKNRVLLTFGGKLLYINAQYITMPNGRKFIATQEALPHTVDHFFEMIIQHNSKVVCQLFSCDKETSYLQKRETDLFFVTVSLSNTSSPVLKRCEVTLKRKTDNKKYEFTHLWVPGWEIVDEVKHFEETVDALELAKKIAGDTTIVVHCYYGLDRTMTFIGIEYGYQRHTKSSLFIDKITIFNELRKMRCGAISKQAQFYFMYYGICRLWMKNKKICESDFPDLKQQYLKALERYRNDKQPQEIKIANETEKEGAALIKTIIPKYNWPKKQTDEPLEKEEIALFTDSFYINDRVNEMKCKECAAGKKKRCKKDTEKIWNRNPKLGVCCEDNQVLKTWPAKNQYVNGQYLYAPNGIKFIATQGPTPETIDHFLDMIIDHKVNVICMLCNYMEPDASNPNKMINACVDYLRLNEGDGEAAVKSSIYTVTRKEVPCEMKGVVRTELTISKKQQLWKQHVVTHLWNTEWPAHKVPNYPIETVNMWRLAKTMAGKSFIIVHGSEGVGRTVSFLGIEIVLSKMTIQGGYPDRTLVIEELRNKRFGSLNNLHQLYFMFFGVICMWKKDNRISEKDYQYLIRIYLAITNPISQAIENMGKTTEEESNQEKSKKEEPNQEKPNKEEVKQEKSKKEEVKQEILKKVEVDDDLPFDDPES